MSVSRRLPVQRVRTTVLARGAHLSGAGSALSAASWLAGALALTTVVWGAVAVFEPTSRESEPVAAPLLGALETSLVADAQPESARSELESEPSTSTEGGSSSAAGTAASSAASTGELVQVRGRLLPLDSQFFYNSFGRDWYVVVVQLPQCPRREDAGLEIRSGQR